MGSLGIGMAWANTPSLLPSSLSSDLISTSSQENNGEGSRSPDFAQADPLPLIEAAPASLDPEDSPQPDPSAESRPETQPPPVLKRGSRGEDVVRLQRQLQDLGYYQGALDGVYGAGTERAIVAFQKQADLTPTGTVDQATWEKIITASPLSSAVRKEENSDSSKEVSPSESASSRSPDSTEAEDELGGSPMPEEKSTPQDTASNSPEKPPARFGRGILLATFLLGVMGASIGILFLKPRFFREIKLAGTPSQNPRLSLEEVATTEVQPGWPVPQGNGARVVAGSIGQQSEPSGEQPAALANGMTETAIAPSNIGPSPEETTRLTRFSLADELLCELRSPEGSKRHKAIWELGQYGNSTAIQPLVDAMLDADSKERSLILAALSEIGMRSLKPMNRALALSLQDENSEVRKNAIRDLVRLYDLLGQMSQMLAHAVQDPDPEVQETAQWALQQLNRVRQSARWPSLEPGEVNSPEQPSS